MKKNISVKEGNLDDVLLVHENIVEFDEKHPPKDFFIKRYENTKHIIIISYYNEFPIGYIIGYEIDNDNFYCWLAGVDVNYRRCSALSMMMNYLIEWCHKNNYKKISIKTRNKYRNMLMYLIKNNWNFISVENKDTLSEYRINLELNLNNK